MKQFITFLTLMLLLSLYCEARVRYVDKNGGAGRYTTIQAAIDAAIDGDTVRILPGIYNESINIGKNIVVQGGGILCTTIFSDASDVPAVDLSAGKLMLTKIISMKSNGVNIKNSIISNCLINNCSGHGIAATGQNAKSINCISMNNTGDGYYDKSYYMSCINCIAIYNKGCGYGGYFSNNLDCYYCCGFGNNDRNFVDMRTNIGNTEENPGLDNEFRISKSSKCFDAGDPNILDLDGTRSDMGYYGGPDAPLLPCITFPQHYILNDDGTIQFDMQGKVGY